VTYNGNTYKCLISAVSTVVNAPTGPAGQSFWQRQSPYVLVNAPFAVNPGDTFTVTATTDLGVPVATLTVIDLATGKEQDQTNPIVTPARPGSNGTRSWTITAARAGAVVFSVAVSGEFNDPACSCSYFKSMVATSEQVWVGTPTLSATNAVLNCQSGLSAPIQLSWSGPVGVTTYSVLYSRTSGGVFQIIGYPLSGTTTSFTVWDKEMAGYYKVRAASRFAQVESNVATVSLIAPPCAAPPPVCPTPVPPPIAALTIPPGISASVGGTLPMIQLNWNTPSGNIDTHVLRSTTSGGPYTLVATVNPTNTSFGDQSVTSGVRYYYVVQADFHWVAGTGTCQQVSQVTSPTTDEVTAVAPGP
jgi:hypothetical protein